MLRTALAGLLGLSISVAGVLCFAIAPQVVAMLEVAGCGFAILWPMLAMALVPLGALAYLVIDRK